MFYSILPGSERSVVLVKPRDCNTWLNLENAEDYLLQLFTDDATENTRDAQKISGLIVIGPLRGRGGNHLNQKAKKLFLPQRKKGTKKYEPLMSMGEGGGGGIPSP